MKEEIKLPEHGGRSREIGEKNREAVRKFFKQNPDSTYEDCKMETGLSLLTIGNHVKAIRAEK